MIKPPLIFSNVCAEFGIDAIDAFGPLIVWEISCELLAHELAYQVLNEAAIGTAEAVALDKAVSRFIIGTVFLPYRLYRLYRFINWIEETMSKPEVHALLEDSIRRVFVKRAPAGLPNDTVAEDRQRKILGVRVQIFKTNRSH